MQRTIDGLDEPSSDLKWCLHVIKNDFLQISNSILNSNMIGGKARRFSKTQRLLTFEESVETGVLNSWVTQCLNGISNVVTIRDYSSSSQVLGPPVSVVPAPILRQKSGGNNNSEFANLERD